MHHTSFADYFVGTPRPQQSRVLEELTDAWDQADVFVLEMPVATGKSKIAEAVARRAASKRGGNTQAAVLVPNNLLLQQYLDSGTKGFRQLRAKQHYVCNQGGSCEDRARRIGGHCRSVSGNRYAADGCPYLRDLGGSRSADRLLVTYHSYLANKLYRPVLIADEAHNLLGFLQELAGKTLWRSTYKWPREFASLDDVRAWVFGKKTTRDANTELLQAVLAGNVHGYSVWLGEEELRGRPVECVKLIALDVRNQPPLLWPHQTEKIVLMSATIGRLDIEALGLAGRRVKYISTDSPIPVDRRPFLHHPIADLSYRGRLENGADLLATFLEEELLPAHAGERGMIHAPYALAAELRALLGDHPRLVFHDRWNKRDVVSEGRSRVDRPASGGVKDDSVLVGSGLAEGLDLAYDRARFQLLTAPPRRSVADPGMLWLAENHPEQYQWLTIRDIAQQYGRGCRAPDDECVTINADSSCEPELASPQVPAWLRDAMQPSQ